MNSLDNKFMTIDVFVSETNNKQTKTATFEQLKKSVMWNLITGK